MSPLVGLFVCVGVVAGVVAAAWWAVGEGVRQGDEPGDASSRLTWTPGPHGGRVGIEIRNPGAGVLVAAATATRVRHRRLVTGRGRTTPRRTTRRRTTGRRMTRRRTRPSVEGRLLAVPADARGSLEWTVVPDPRRRWLVVDVHLWQPASRLRRHRRVLDTRAPAISPARRRAVALPVRRRAVAVPGSRSDVRRGRRRMAGPGRPGEQPGRDARPGDRPGPRRLTGRPGVTDPGRIRFS